MKLSLVERETILLYNQAEPMAEIYTHCLLYTSNITKPTVVLHRAVSFLRSLLTSICMSWTNL